MGLSRGAWSLTKLYKEVIGGDGNQEKGKQNTDDMKRKGEGRFKRHGKVWQKTGCGKDN